MFKQIAGIFLAAIICTFTLSGCDQVSDKFAQVMGSKAPDEALVSAQKKLSHSEFLAAKQETESFVKNPGPKQGVFALIMAKAEAGLGQTDQSLFHLGMAVKAGAADPQEMMFDPAFETMRTDVRFVALITALSTATDVGPANGVAQSAAPAEPTAPGAAGVQINSSGIEVKAGDVSVKLTR